MPAYRSPQEAEIREPVVERLRVLMPGCRIIHEINCSNWGPNRIDVVAVGVDNLAAVEVKGSKDKLDRLPDQVFGMRNCTHYAISALHEKHFKKVDSHVLGRAYSSPDQAKGSTVWGFGLDETRNTYHYMEYNLADKWVKPMMGPPFGLINMMWRDELREIVSRHGMSRRSSSLTIDEMISIVRWNLTGKDVAREVCAKLRQRKCAEADPEIYDTEGM